MRECMIHFCFLNAERDKDGCRPVISKDIHDLGITEDLAREVCDEIYLKCDSIAAWVSWSER